MGLFDEMFEVEETARKEKVLFIDYGNLIYRMVYVAGASYKEKKSQFMMGETDISFSIDDMYIYWENLVLGNILDSIKEYEPSRVIVAIDSKNYWRKKIYSEYKAHRKEAREESIIDFDIFYERLDAFNDKVKKIFSNIYWLKVDTCEADDIIAVLSKQYAKDNWEIVLISTDKDFVQLHTYDGFKQFNPIKKEFMKSANPKVDLEIKILTGDKSDNISAVKERCGPKTAEKMIAEGLSEIETNEEIKRLYIRNKLLIDFTKIPEEISDAIVSAFNSYEISEVEGSSTWEWLSENNFPRIYDDWQQYYRAIKGLK